MLFAKCPRLLGQCHVVEDALRVRTARDVSLEHWSLYDRSGRMIRDSGFFRGVPEYQSVGGPLGIDPRPDAPCLPPAEYFWLGYFQTHFGHFLVGTLSRLWAWSQHADAATKLVYVGELDPPDLLAIPYVRACLGALGVREDQLLRVSGPLRFPAIRVAEPAFVENFSIAPAYDRMMRGIAAVLLRDAGDGGTPHGLSYLSKARVTAGNRIIVNEDALTDRLAAHGFRIEHPEQATFLDQIRHWSRAECSVGFSGSAFHTSAFVGNAAMCTISNNLLASSNQAMIDRVAGNRGLFLHPIGGLTEAVSTIGGFHDAIVIRDPAWMADELMRIVEGFRRREIAPQTVSRRPRREWAAMPPETPFGLDLTERGVARTTTTAAGGRASAWQIRLGAPYAVNEIHVHGRGDPAATASACPVSIAVSLDGGHWTPVYRSGAAIDSHGDREVGVLRWRTAFLTLARFVRVEVDPGSGFELDRVALTGERPDPALVPPIYRVGLAPPSRRVIARRLARRPRLALAWLRARWGSGRGARTPPS